MTAIHPADVHQALQLLDMSDWPVIQCHPTAPRQTREERDRDVDHVLRRHLEAAVGFIMAGRTARARMELDQGVRLAARILGEDTTTDPHKEEDPRAGEGVRVCANESRPAAGADLTSPLRVRPPGKVTGPAAHAGTGDALAERDTVHYFGLIDTPSVDPTTLRSKWVKR